MPTVPRSHDSDDQRLDEALEESFPANDPPSVTRPHDLDPEADPAGDED